MEQKPKTLNEVGEAVALILAPEPFPDAPPPTPEQRKLLDRIERLERKFIATESGKKRYRIRNLIEALEEKLTVNSLRLHNRELLDRLSAAEERNLKLAEALSALNDQWQELKATFE